MVIISAFCNSLVAIGAVGPSTVHKATKGGSNGLVFVNVDCKRGLRGSEVLRISGSGLGKCWKPHAITQTQGGLKVIFADTGVASKRMASLSKPVIMRNRCPIFPRNCEISLLKDWPTGHYSVVLNRLLDSANPIVNFNEDGCFVEVVLGLLPDPNHEPTRIVEPVESFETSSQQAIPSVPNITEDSQHRGHSSSASINSASGTKRNTSNRLVVRGSLYRKGDPAGEGGVPTVASDADPLKRAAVSKATNPGSGRRLLVVVRPAPVASGPNPSEQHNGQKKVSITSSNTPSGKVANTGNKQTMQALGEDASSFGNPEGGDSAPFFRDSIYSAGTNVSRDNIRPVERSGISGGLGTEAGENGQKPPSKLRCDPYESNHNCSDLDYVSSVLNPDASGFAHFDNKGLNSNGGWTVPNQYSGRGPAGLKHLPLRNPFAFVQKIRTVAENPAPSFGASLSNNSNLRDNGIAAVVETPALPSGLFAIPRKPSAFSSTVANLAHSATNFDDSPIETFASTRGAGRSVEQSGLTNNGNTLSNNERRKSKRDWSHLMGYGSSGKPNNLSKLGQLALPLGAAESAVPNLVRQINWADVKGIVAMSAKSVVAVSEFASKHSWDDNLSLLDQAIEFLNYDPSSRKVVSSTAIVIDPGHGGKDAGLSSKDGLVQEKNVTLLMAKKLRQKLTQYGFRVYLTREDDSFISVNKRVALIERASPKFVLSLQLNSSSDKSTSGVSVHIVPMDGIGSTVPAVSSDKGALDSKSRYSSSKRLFLSVVRFLSKRGVNIEKKQFPIEDLYLLAKAGRPGILVEIGHITNSGDLSLLSDGKFTDLLADAISKSVMAVVTGSDKAVKPF